MIKYILLIEYETAPLFLTMNFEITLQSKHNKIYNSKDISAPLGLHFRISQFGMNTFMYAPKDDFKHRSAWRVPYSMPESEQLRRLIEESKLHHIQFIYALSPGLDMLYSSEKEMKLLTDKLDQVQ